MVEKIDIDLTDKEYILIYNGTKAVLHMSHENGQISTPDINTVERFGTLQELVDKALVLGLEYTVQNVIDAIEAGATIPQSVIDWAKSQDNDIETVEKLDELFP